MSEENLKNTILHKSVALFSEQGFHGTTMRMIASAADCSLPTLYYYYKNKEELFTEIAVKEYMKIISRLNAGLDFSLPPEELYMQVVRQRMALNAYDRAVYKLAIKVWLGFEGNSRAKESLTEWENGRIASNRRILDSAVGDEGLKEVFASVFINYMESVINKIILLDEPADADGIARQIRLILSFARG
jgi:AcrR family transcriptional regulator